MGIICMCDDPYETRHGPEYYVDQQEAALDALGFTWMWHETIFIERRNAMNYRFRKKPIVIEAFQMTKERRASNFDWPNWLHQAWQKDPSEGSVWAEDYPNSDGTDRLCIGTLEGVYIVSWDDWIIQGVKDEIYACKPDIFEMTYEPVA